MPIRRPAIALLFCLAAPLSPSAGQTRAPRSHRDPVLQRQLEGAVQGFRGSVGIYVRNLRTGATAAIQADSAFPTASMIKVPILLATFDAIQQGKLQFTQQLTYTDSLAYVDEDELGYQLKDSAKVRLSWIEMLMLTLSDNTSALWLQSLAGTGTTINQWLADHGYQVTRVNSRTPGREEMRARYGWGVTTPREMAELLVMIREGRAVSPAASQEMYRHLTRSYWTGEAISQLPPWVQAATKQGAVDHSRSEVVLVNAPSGDYVFSVITKDQADTTYESNNEGWVLIRKVSALLWRHFEPDHPFTPAEGVGRFKP
ncbi:MAG TPA: serine hydrolase [Gemmatimonadales bacterium]|nr:serine hydrolase [Gemmatimonadales bacterium]